MLLAEEVPEIGFVAPRPGPVSMTIHHHVDDADATIARAAAAGATVLRAPEDRSHGERSGTILDPSGHRWLIGHASEEVAPAER